MTQPYRIISKKPNTVLDIGWDPSNFCNFKCRYCFEDSNAGTHRNPDNLELIVKNFKHLMNYYQQTLGKTKFQFFVAGGEPTLWKELGLFIEKIKTEHNVYFSLVSNGSRTLRWWKEYAHAIDNAHLTHHIAQGSVEHITKVADILYENGTKTTVKVLMDPLHWDQGIKDIEYMKKQSKHPWFIMAAEVLEQAQMNNRIPVNVPRYSEDQLKYLKKDLKRIPGLLWFWKNRHLLKEEIRIWDSKAYLDNGSTINARPGTYFNNGWNNFKGWNCSIGLDRIYINWTGNISGACKVVPFGRSNYYNILDKDFSQQFNPNMVSTVCPNTGCWCMPETHITKYINIKPV
jgi:organic radical activating enzyme